MQSDCPECFGKSSAAGKLDRCPSCEYQESCKFCAEDDGSSCDRRLGHISYERYSYSREVSSTATAPDQDLDQSISCGHEDDTAGVRRVMEFLLDLDNYTAELVSDVLHGDVSTTSEIARKRGISRQAVHRKIIDCCTQYPELRQLFIARLYRCRRILRDSKRLKPKHDPNQLEFNF